MGDLSHMVLSWGGQCGFESWEINAESGFKSVSAGPVETITNMHKCESQPTQHYGMKIDIESGLQGNDEEWIITIVVQGIVSETTVSYALKSGRDVKYGETIGPNCDCVRRRRLQASVCNNYVENVMLDLSRQSHNNFSVCLHVLFIYLELCE